MFGRREPGALRSARAGRTRRLIGGAATLAATMGLLVACTGGAGTAQDGTSGRASDGGTSGSAGTSAPIEGSATASGEATGASSAAGSEGPGTATTGAPGDASSASPSPTGSAPAADPTASALSQAQPPAEWAGTVLGDPGRPEGRDDDFYQIAGMFHDDDGMVMGRDPITASQLENSELAGGQTDLQGNEYSLAGCEGSTKISVLRAVTCTMTSPTAPRLYVYVRATQTAYGHPGLIFHFTKDQSDGPFKLPGGDLAVGGAMGTSKRLADVTPDEAVGMIDNAVLTQHDHEWDGSPDPTSTCEVRDGGAHLMCSVTGTPEHGAGDGIWYGTYRPNNDERVQYLFTRLPAQG